MRASEAWRLGLFQRAHFETLPGGQHLVTLSRRGYPGEYQFRVRDLGQPNERVTEDHDVPWEE